MTPGFRSPVRVAELLQPLHDGVGLGAPLRLDERRHVPAGAVLGLQRAVVLLHDELDDVVDEARVLVDRGLVVEGLRDDEVEVPVLGVAEDDRLGVAVPGEEPRQVDGRVGEVLDREGDVLDEDRRAAPADRADRGERPLPHLPEQRLLRRVVGEAGRLEQRERSRRAAAATPRGPAPLGLLRRLELDEEAPRRPSGTARIDAGTPGWLSTDRSEARSSSSSAFAPESRSGTIAAQAACIVGKRRRPVYLHREVRHRGEDRLRDEGERPLRPDEEVAEDLDRPLEVEEGVQRVAGRVLHPVLRPDARPASAGSASSFAFRSRSPCQRAGSAARNRASASGAAVSIRVPEGRRKVSDSSVW